VAALFVDGLAARRVVAAALRVRPAFLEVFALAGRAAALARLAFFAPPLRAAAFRGRDADFATDFFGRFPDRLAAPVDLARAPVAFLPVAFRLAMTFVLSEP
jgi:hypothetical protein